MHHAHVPGGGLGTTKVWNRFDDGRHVGDHYVVATTNAADTKPVPRC